MPLFLQHIQDRDIWTYIVPNTLEFVTYFYQQDFNFEQWEIYLDNLQVELAVKIGKNWLHYQKKIIDVIIDTSATIITHEIDGQQVKVAYCNTPYFKSDIGNKLFEKFPDANFSCAWDYDLYRNQTLFSLRSTNDRFDVSTIAKKIKGGGHRNASGAALSGIHRNLPFPVINKCSSNLIVKYEKTDLIIGSTNDTDDDLMEYHQIIVADIVGKTSYVMHKIDNDYVIGLYCNSSIFKDAI